MNTAGIPPDPVVSPNLRVSQLAIGINQTLISDWSLQDAPNRASRSYRAPDQLSGPPIRKLECEGSAPVATHEVQDDKRDARDGGEHRNEATPERLAAGGV